jgi:hypothetical protein
LYPTLQGKKEKKKQNPIFEKEKDNLNGDIKYPKSLEGVMWPFTKNSNNNVLFLNRKYLFKI